MKNVSIRQSVKGRYIGNASGIPHLCKTCNFQWDEAMFYERDTNFWGYILEDGGNCPHCGETDEAKVGILND